jgi:hypothetical protein
MRMDSEISLTKLPPLPDPITSDDEPSAALGREGTTDEDLVALPRPLPHFRFRVLRAGCWLLNYTPVASPLVTFDGTLRVEKHSGGRTASGDLYQRRLLFVGRPRPIPLLGPAPNPANGIPIFARSQYRRYLRITSLPEVFIFGQSFDLGLEMHRFTAASGTWTNEGAFTARMTFMPAPGGYPSSGDYIEGDVRNAAGVVVGRLKGGWVSPRYRRVVVEIDTVADSERPLDNGAGIGWAEVFDAIGYDGTVVLGDTNVAQPSGAGWSDAEMHAGMLARRDPVSLDSQWRYHVLAVRTIDSTERGIMYDASGTDSNNVPREGVGIATHWMIPDTPAWGLVRGQRFGAAAAPFFRTAVHELGHALGLFHNTVDNGFMNTTDVIAGNATAATPFPNNIKWAFADDDLKRLRHYPDIYIRPGGTAFGSASMSNPPITPTDLEVEMPDLTLTVTPLMPEVPIGAPVRVHLELKNTGDMEVCVPAKLSLKTDFVRGYAIDPSGTKRTFSPLIHCIEDRPMRVLAPGETIAADLTLLRGAEGALFPAGGLYQIGVEVSWDVEGVHATVHGRTDVMVMGATDSTHAEAALRLLATPDAHLVLALGGDHLPDGIGAIHAAMEHGVLRPHYAVIEAKRVARLKRKDAADESVEQLLDGNVVMSESEHRKIKALIGDAKSRRKPQRQDA